VQNAKNAAPAEDLENTSAPVSSKQRDIEIRGIRTVRNLFMPSVSELVVQASPRVVSTGHDIILGGEGLKTKQNPRVAGWGFAT
jgi:hypothetical protein